MFALVSDHSSQKLGIDVHKLTTYAFNHGLLEGGIVHDSTTKDFNLFVSPNLSALERIAIERPDLPLSLEFDRARTHTISLGEFKTENDAEDTVLSVEKHYQTILKERGARKRHLIEQNGKLSLALSESANDLRYGEAVLQAIRARVFAMLETDEVIDHRNVVGRIIPAYIKAMGFKEYYVSHDLSKEGFGKVRFVIKDHYAFDIYKPLTEGRPAYIKRYGYRPRHDEYVLDSSAELTVENLKKNVLSFIEGLARDLGYFDKSDSLTEAKEAAINIRPKDVIIILGSSLERPPIYGLTAPIPNSDQPKAIVHEFKPRMV